MRLDSANITKFRLSRTTTPSSPASGFVYFYIKDSDGKPYVKNSSGTETQVGVTGALVLLGEEEASSSASLDFTSLISSTYDQYVFEIINLVSETDAVDLLVRFSIDNGATYLSTSIYQNNSYIQATTGSTTLTSTGAAFFARGANEISNDSGRSVNGSLKIYNPNSDSLYKRICGNLLWFGTTGGAVNTVLDGAFLSTDEVNAVRFLFSSGDIASGVIRMYGIVK